MENFVRQSLSEFLNYDRKEDLDTFFRCYFSRTVWNVIKMLLILSHGQASVERSFSANKASKFENLKEASYVSHRTELVKKNADSVQEKRKEMFHEIQNMKWKRVHLEEDIAASDLSVDGLLFTNSRIL
ncbi:hypothetical protein PR048_005707 [Dryococelus australis]|uniref:HAT C-terminal dimerisation domain-containing protein n=1 Tax=Dryococelus australis TaxID=614101 RepID=A0ABQ9IA10_9NEOP|nr:hypothetical protein PR048_005707 [Dryococelus australis]